MYHIECKAEVNICYNKSFSFECYFSLSFFLNTIGKNESRSCGRLPLNDCKTANSVELCYCTGALCNGNRPEILLEETESDERLRTQLEDEKEERETRKIWQKGETDDEDLLGRGPFILTYCTTFQTSFLPKVPYLKLSTCTCLIYACTSMYLVSFYKIESIVLLFFIHNLQRILY